jgi:hypothetical protein
MNEMNQIINESNNYIDLISKHKEDVKDVIKKLGLEIIKLEEEGRLIRKKKDDLILIKEKLYHSFIL